MLAELFQLSTTHKHNQNYKKEEFPVFVFVEYSLCDYFHNSATKMTRTFNEDARPCCSCIARRKDGSSAWLITS